MIQQSSQKVKGPESLQHDLTANHIFTNVSDSDRENNGQTLTLKPDQTFNLHSRNYAWDSRFQQSWNWSSSLDIDGTWSYDKDTKTIILNGAKISASLQQALKNQEEVLEKGFPIRVIKTENFDFKESKEINAFVVWWNYGEFSKVGQGKLKRK